MKLTLRARLSFLFFPMVVFMGLATLLDTEIFIHEVSEGEENPGFFTQWFNEKKDANGEIPPFLRSQWAKYDAMKLSVSRRSNDNPIDTIIELGPKSVGGRTRGLWIDPRNEKIMLAAAISGGLWRTVDGGLNWKPLNEHQISMMPSCITSNPFNPNEIYYGTGESRANSADVDGEGVFKSTDGGLTFNQITTSAKTPGFQEIWDIEHAKDDSQTVFVGTQTNGLYRSTDGGSTFINVYAGGNKQVTDILCLNNKRVIATLHSSQVVASDSLGKPGTFKAITFPNAPGSGSYRRIQLASPAKYPSVVYAVFEGYAFDDVPVAFYKSSDGGRTWTKKTAPGGAGASYQAYCLLLGAHPTDSNSVVCGGVKLVRSRDGGKTWTDLTVGHSDHHSFAYLPKTTNEFVVGTDGGMYKYPWNSTEILATLNNGYRVTQFYAGAYGPTGLVAIAGAQDNGTHVARQPMVSQRFFGGDGAYCHIGLQDGSIAYMSYQNAAIHVMKSFSPTGPSWATNITDPAFATDVVDFINLYEMNPADQYQVYYRTNRGLYRTTDMGSSWTKLNLSIRAGIKAIGISKQENPVVYFGGTGSQLYKIEKAATTVAGKEVNYNSSVPLAVTNDNIKGMHVHPQNPYILYVAMSNISNQPRAWRVTGLDSVANKPVWTNISGDLPPGLPVNMLAVDPANPDAVFFAGTDFGLYYTIDSGKTWQKDYRLPNVAVHEIKMREDRTLFAFTHGRGMFAIKLKAPKVGIRSMQGRKTLQAKIYPNPSSDGLQVNSAVDLNGANYSVMDVGGRVVASGVLSRSRGDVLGDGTSAFTVDGGYRINTRNLKNGSYFLQISLGRVDGISVSSSERGRVFTEKFIVQH
ncbi:MAG: T9SS type A sorting domain-containing protein [Bacteroidota bacterium]